MPSGWAPLLAGTFSMGLACYVPLLPLPPTQAKDLLARYGSAYLITSISFAVVSFAACYAAVDSGVDVAGLLQRVGLQVRGRVCRLFPKPSAAAGEVAWGAGMCGHWLGSLCVAVLLPRGPSCRGMCSRLLPPLHLP